MITFPSPFPSRPASQDTPGRRFRRLCLYFLGSTGMFFCGTILYLGQRVIMRMGGFVASGGPYVIAHPAPGWVWMVPVSILSGLVFFFICLGVAERVPDPKLLPALAWPGLFLSLGWNFFEFGVWPPGQEGLVWGWLICGIIFFLMGGLPLLWVVRSFWKTLRQRARQGATTSAAWDNKKAGFLLLQLAAIALGLMLGRAFFMSQAYPSRPLAMEQKTVERPALDRPAQVELESNGRRLLIAGSVDGRWRLLYEGQAYSRWGELPAAVRRDFDKTLAGLKKLLE